MMTVPFVDLRAQHAPLNEAIEGAFHDLMGRGDFIMGAAVERFETEYAAYIGAKHAIGVGTGLSAIELALRAFEVGPGDEVITPANTFIATVLAIMAVGATPVFVDMDAATYGIDAAKIDAGDHLAHEGDRAGAPLRPAGRSRRGDGGGAAPQPDRRSKMRRRRTARVTRAGAPAASATPRRSASTRRRTSARSATAA